MAQPHPVIPEILQEWKIYKTEGKTSLRCFTMLAPAGNSEFSLHRHSACEIAIIIQGEGEYTVRHTNHTIAYPFQPGTVFLFGSYEAHLITHASQPVTWIILHIEPYFIWNPDNPTYDSKHLRVFFDRSFNGDNRLDYPNEQLEVIRKVVYSIWDELQYQQTDYQMMVLAEVQKLLISLYRLQFSAEAAQENGHAHYLDKIQQAYIYMNSHFLTPLCMETLAAQANLSPSYFSILFKECNGVSPWEYIIIKRVRYAMKLLGSNPNSSILNIALESGFSNTANFNKAFRRIAGCTPSAFRKNGVSGSYDT